MSEEEIIEQLVANLTLDAEDTSNARRKKECAEDDRPSSEALGAVSAAFMGCVSAVLLALDSISLVVAAKTIYQTILTAYKIQRQPNTSDNTKSKDDISVSEDMSIENVDTNSSTNNSADTNG